MKRIMKTSVIILILAISTPFLLGATTNTNSLISPEARKILDKLSSQEPVTYEEIVFLSVNKENEYAWQIALDIMLKVGTGIINAFDESMLENAVTEQETPNDSEYISFAYDFATKSTTYIPRKENYDSNEYESAIQSFEKNNKLDLSNGIIQLSTILDSRTPYVKFCFQKNKDLNLFI